MLEFLMWCSYACIIRRLSKLLLLYYCGQSYWLWNPEYPDYPVNNKLYHIKQSLTQIFLFLHSIVNLCQSPKSFIFSRMNLTLSGCYSNKAMLLLGWNHHYKISTVGITNWLIVIYELFISQMAMDLFSFR